MLPVLLAAFLLGIAAGLRTFTAPAVLWLMRHNGLWAIVLAVLAVLEYAGDLHPKAPARTGAVGLTARAIAGAFVGWSIASLAGADAATTTIAAVAGIVGACIGAYGGLAIRLRAMAAIGAVPAALLEDVIAIVVAVVVVSYSPA
jgi:uncharacterized membrane protein